MVLIIILLGRNEGKGQGVGAFGVSGSFLSPETEVESHDSIFHELVRELGDGEIAAPTRTHAHTCARAQFTKSTYRYHILLLY